MLPRCRPCVIASLSCIITTTLVCLLYTITDVHQVAPTVHQILTDPRNIRNTSIRKNGRSVRLLCWVTTMLKNLQKKTQYVKTTWGKRCDVMLFIGSEENKTFPVIKLNVPEGRDHLSHKTEAAFKYVYDHYVDQADWFLKADDDTFVLVDNLKHFLSEFNPSEGLYFGFTFTGGTPQGYNSGGAGYVLSKEALKQFILYGTGKRCPISNGVEDMFIGTCMHQLGIKNINTLDEKNRTRFHAYDPVTHMDVSDPYLKSRSSYGYKTGVQNISDHPFTFHYLSGRDIRLMEFLIYHVQHKDK